MFNAYVEPALSQAEIQAIKEASKEKGVILATGCIDTQKANLAYALTGEEKRALIVTENDQSAKQFYEDYRFYHQNTYLYPAKDLLFYNADVASFQLMEQRLTALRAIVEDPGAALILSIPALMEKITGLDELRKSVLEFKKGMTIDVTKLSDKLSDMGYERSSLCEVPGQYAVRGDIIDIYSMTEETPVRIELFGDEIEEIRTFDPETQRSTEKIGNANIYPAGDTYTADDTILSYFDKKNTMIFLDDITRLESCARATEEEFVQSAEMRAEQESLRDEKMPEIFGADEIIARLSTLSAVALSTIEPPSGAFKFKKRFNISAQAVMPYNNSFEVLMKDLKRYVNANYRIIYLSASRTRANRMADDIREAGLAAFYSEDRDLVLKPGEIMVQTGHARGGFEYPLSRFVLISERDIFGKKNLKRRRKKEYSGEKISSFAELAVGDYVVHESHGLGRYLGIEKMMVDGALKDYMKIEYDGSNLYVLATGLDRLQKYASADAGKPKLNKLGGEEWKNTKRRVRTAVKDIARELVALYAARNTKSGHVYGSDTVWQLEFEELFPYEETEDQIRAIEDTKRDMESNRIMDRLICGDVGYGKTEVALRAAFKAVQENKQVAFLVPTTILAQQHYNTFTERLKDFPVRVDMLSRFRTKAEQDKTIKALASGMVDIVIGTHRLLSKDVKFKDLGLLVIDEEQRFGVTHKEKIKELKKTVDVLTLTATPIPRTLHMSLIGIRDMSVLEEPPRDRMPIQTYVCEYNPELVREAICRELGRGGQVYYVFNRVKDIAGMARQIKELVPEAEVAFADGQMKEAELERVMVDFINHDIDVLVTTTIIETGLDIPNVNTIIIHDADRYGLSQLYQLRGRVGRSNRTAYAFLMYRRDKVLKEVAEKRLSAIREFTELGSGIKIAMRDLEIRGAGNLLGSQQHGHMNAVGYDLYCKMLSKAVAAEKGEEEEKEDFETVVDMPIDAYIPQDYIDDEFRKLDMYKRIAGIEDAEDYAEMQDELEDRFGAIPKPVENLLKVALLKAFAHSSSIREIKQKGKTVEMPIMEDPDFDPVKLPDIINSFDGRVRYRKYKTGSYFLYDPEGSTEDTMELLTAFFGKLAKTRQK